MRAFTGLVDTNYILDAICDSELLEVQVRLLQHFLYVLFVMATKIMSSGMDCSYLWYREIMSEGAMTGWSGYFIKAVH
jgi:hypothetical protein